MTRRLLEVRSVVILLLVAVAGAMPIVAQETPTDLKDWGPFAKPWKRYETKGKYR